MYLGNLALYVDRACWCWICGEALGTGNYRRGMGMTWCRAVSVTVSFHNATVGKTRGFVIYRNS